MDPDSSYVQLSDLLDLKQEDLSDNEDKLSDYLVSIEDIKKEIKDEYLTDTLSIEEELIPVEAIKTEETIELNNIDSIQPEEIYIKCEEEYIDTLQITEEDNAEKEVSDENYKCSKCEYEASHKIYLERHMVDHEISDIHRCSLCNYVTKKKWNLTRHQLRKHPYDPITNSTVQPTPKKKEISPKKDKTPLKCHECFYQATSNKVLKRHMLCHKRKDEIDVLKCTHCGFRTIYKWSLSKHISNCEPDEDVEFNFGASAKVVKCPHCPYEADRKCDLKRHLLFHKDPAKIYMHKCSECNYQTMRKRNLNRHLQLHRDPEHSNAHKCPECPYKTMRKSNFNAHMLRHVDQRSAENQKPK